jgi:hypothetical protein
MPGVNRVALDAGADMPSCTEASSEERWMSGASRISNSCLVEWNYGEYEGRRGAEIRTERPEWQLSATVAREVNRRKR